MKGVRGITALVTIVLAITLIAAAAPSQQHDVPLENQTPDRVVLPQDIPDRIVLVTIDTLRADHLSSYGYPRNTSPFIDSLAEDGVLFERLVASASLTAPNHASIFTSLYPIQHNVLRNGQKLNGSFLTMAELLSSIGYQTAGFVSTDIHFKVGNMEQGFDVFDEPKIRKGRRLMRLRNRQADGTVNNEFRIPKDRGPILIYRQANGTVNKAVQWLDTKQPEDRFFLWVHLFDPHTPYDPPERFLEGLEKQPEGEKQSFARFLFNEHYLNFPAFKKDKDDNKIPEIINKYDAEVMFVDKEIERLYRHFQDKRLDSNTLWIITADHGEGLGNHNFLSHGALIYNEQIHIPLIFHFTSTPANGLVVGQVVEQVDILPTVAELVGAELSGQAKPIAGTSMVPLLQEEDLGAFPEKYAFAYKRGRRTGDTPEFVKKRFEARQAFIKKQLDRRGLTATKRQNTRSRLTDAERRRILEEKFALQDREYKYISNANGEDEFYNLTEDPYEVYNLVGTGLKEEDMFRDALMLKVKWLNENASGKPESVDRETIERLKSLGYIQ